MDPLHKRFSTVETARDGTVLYGNGMNRRPFHVILQNYMDGAELLLFA